MKGLKKLHKKLMLSLILLGFGCVFIGIVVLLLNPKVNLFNKAYSLVNETVSLIPNSKNTSDLASNTKKLQDAIDNVSNKGGGTVKIPSGTYYFSAGGNNCKGGSCPARCLNEETGNTCDNGAYYVIYMKDNVLVEGSGMDKTILKPYGSYYHGLDMFAYFGGTAKSYLNNADFKNFTIDGSEASRTSGSNYNARGKGFMLSPVKDCDWDNVKVMNTDGTGFGMDHPIHSTVKNCIAIGNGKGATEEMVGASGFGIGTGYEGESMYIKNCQSIGNRKFGYFFEHQGRFSPGEIGANTARVADGKNDESPYKGFVVENSIAKGNMYDFGGEKSYDVTYINCTSSQNYSSTENPLKNSNKQVFYFGMDSQRIHLINNNIEYKYNDTSNSKAITWAIKQNIIDIGQRVNTLNSSMSLSKSAAIRMIWRMDDRASGNHGLVLGAEQVTFDGNYPDLTNPLKAWWDLPDYYVAVRYAIDKGILKPTTSSQKNFEPDKAISKGDFLLMLYRYANKPTTTFTSSYTDIKGTYFEKAIDWAVDKKIISNGYGSFNSDNGYTINEAVNILYNYYLSTTPRYEIKYDCSTNGGSCSGSTTTTVTQDEKVDLSKAAYKSGYQFVGWNTNPSATSALTSLNSVSKDTTLYAIFKKNIYVRLVDYNGNKIQDVNKSYTIYNNDGITYTIPKLNTYTNYTSLCWSNSTSPFSSCTNKGGDKLTNLKNSITLYGLYEKKIKIKYDLNGGIGTIPTTKEVTVTVNSSNISIKSVPSITLPLIMTSKDGYSPLVWNTKKDGTGIDYYENEIATFEEDTTLYVRWIKNKVTEQKPNNPTETTPKPQEGNSSSGNNETPVTPPSTNNETPPSEVTPPSTNKEEPITPPSTNNETQSGGVTLPNTNNETSIGSSPSINNGQSTGKGSGNTSGTTSETNSNTSSSNANNVTNKEEITSFDLTKLNLKYDEKWTRKDIVITLLKEEEEKNIDYIKVNGTEIKNDNGYTYTFTKNGTYTIEIKDKKDNIYKKQINIKNIDRTKPTITKATEETKDGVIELLLELNDDESGVSKIEYSLDNKTFNDCLKQNSDFTVIDSSFHSGNSSVILQFTSGEKEIYFKATNNAGVESEIKTVKIEKIVDKKEEEKSKIDLKIIIASVIGVVIVLLLIIFTRKRK